MSSQIVRRVRRKASRIVTSAKPRLRYQSLYKVEGEREGRVWLYPDGHYVFASTNGEELRGHWHVIDGSLLVFDQYALTNDNGATFYSPWLKLTLVEHRQQPQWVNANPFFYDPARSVYDVPKLKNRDAALLTTLPANAVIAEIGVETGTYSASIMKHATPTKFHLIDCWESIPDPWPSHEAQRKNYLGVCEMFKSEIAAERVVVHKGDDIEILSEFPDAYFDWVYLDTTHQYEQTLRELEAIEPKMKPSGYIAGHDYSDSTISRRYGYGVIRAINEFVARGNWEYAWLTRMEWASFVLKRKS